MSSPPDPASEIELGKGSARFSPEAPLTTSSLQANSLTGFLNPYRFLHLDYTSTRTTESSAGPDGVDASAHELSPLLSSSDNSSSFELPRFGRWYSPRNNARTRLKPRARPRKFRVKLLLVCSVLALGAIFTFVSIGKALRHSCWTWKGRFGGGPCNQWTKPGEEEESWWDRHRTEDPDEKVEVPVAIPDFALEYAPFVYLHSEEVYLPINTSQHLEHTIPYLNYAKINYPPPSLTLDDLSDISDELGRRRVFLTSPDDALSEPQWITGKGVTEPKNGYSKAKSTIIVVDKGLRSLDEGWGVVDGKNKDWQEARFTGQLTDVFYFYFYGFNLGPKVGGLRFGNHVGDWENTMIRFVDGVPRAVFFSQHATGIAVDYAAVEKIGKRPVTYSANGTHANYPKAGTHSFLLPFHLLSDYTNRGMLWDPALNTNIYALNFTSSPLPPSNPWYPTTRANSAVQSDSYKLQLALQNPTAPIGWFHFDGFWGDRQLPVGDPRQYGVGGLWHWVNGPRGPRWKDLGRRNMCLDKFETYGRMPAVGACKIRINLSEWEGEGR